MSLADLLHGVSLTVVIFSSVMLGIVIGLLMKGEKPVKRDNGVYSEYEHHG